MIRLRSLNRINCELEALKLLLGISRIALSWIRSGCPIGAGKVRTGYQFSLPVCKFARKATRLQIMFNNRFGEC
jgi:hypothetical protein